MSFMWVEKCRNVDWMGMKMKKIQIMNCFDNGKWLCDFITINVNQTPTILENSLRHFFFELFLKNR